ncbi:MAG TPA: hypothetical protein DCO83_09055 [Mucilaginibacter sp.]|nr:hypothetical protein [Mucilaginibacter sp.]
MKGEILPEFEAIVSLAAIFVLAVGSAKQKMACLYQTYLFTFPVIQVGIFKIMLITITRACVHFNCFYFTKLKTVLCILGKSRFLN